MKRTLALTLPVAALVLSTGCEELDPYLPSVRFDELRVNEIDFEKADVDFAFVIDNPNPVEIDLASFSYALSLQEIQLLEGDDNDGTTLEAVGESELALPVLLDWTDTWDVVQATKGDDYVDFGLEGDFGFDTPLGRALLPYAEDGSFPALRTPKFTFKTFRVKSFDSSDYTAKVEIDLGVTNEHASSLFFQDVDYTVKVDGEKIAEGLVPDLGSVDGATDGTVTLPLEVDLISSGSAAWDAIVNGEEADVGLLAEMDVDTPFGLVPLTVDESGQVQVEYD